MKKYFLFIVILCSTFITYANVIYSGTRFIYNESNKQITIDIKNKNEENDFLIQNWITKDNNNESPFIITPPLFKLKSSQDAILKIIQIEPILENDRESLFYLNSKAIPLIKSENNSLHISFKSIFKLFYRPNGLNESHDDAAKKISFSFNNKREMIIKNDSAYHFTILDINTEEIKNDISLMVLPFSETNIGTVKFTSTRLNWSYINDYGNKIDVNIKDN